MYEKLTQDELTALLSIALEIRSRCIDLKGVIKHQADDSVIGSLRPGQTIPFSTFRDVLPVCSNDAVTPSIGQFYVYLMDTAPNPVYATLNKLLDNVKCLVLPYCTHICTDEPRRNEYANETMHYSCECTLNDTIIQLRKLLNRLRRDIVDADAATTDVHKIQKLADEAEESDGEEVDDDG